MALAPNAVKRGWEGAACHHMHLNAGTGAHLGQPLLAYLFPIVSHRLLRASFLVPSTTYAMAVYVSLRLLLHYTQDPREPRPLETLVPFVSPVIGMMRKKTNYYVTLRY
jgi:hypothetical protein